MSKGSRDRTKDRNKFDENFNKIFKNKKYIDDEINEVAREKGLHADDDRDEIINILNWRGK